MQEDVFIGGKWRQAHDGSRFEVLDPADDSVVASVPACGAIETTEAIAAAEAASTEFADLGFQARAELVLNIARELEARKEELACLITREEGKPLSESRAELDYSISFFDQAAADASHWKDEQIKVPGKKITVHYRPIGPAAFITAWNFPLALLAKKLAPALIAGCPQVIKPAELTPLTALAFAEIAETVGVPPGVVNVVTGMPEAIGQAMLADPRIRKLSFTGSTEVGRLLIKNSATNITRLSLELGGHAPFLVFGDADLDQAVEIAVKAKFRNGGQTCICPNRFLIEDSIHDEFVQRLSTRIGKLKSGRGTEEDVDLGPMIDEEAVAKFRRHCSDACDRGATLICGGKMRSIAGLTDRFPEPTIVTGLTSEMLAWNEETFGPLCPVRSFQNEDEALALANDTQYGLASYACTSDSQRLGRLGAKLQTGIVGLNDPGPAIAAVPMGGVKHSGYGREGGKWAFEPYLAAITVSECT